MLFDSVSGISVVEGTEDGIGTILSFAFSALSVISVSEEIAPCIPEFSVFIVLITESGVGSVFSAYTVPKEGNTIKDDIIIIKFKKTLLFYTLYPFIYIPLTAYSNFTILNYTPFTKANKQKHAFSLFIHVLLTPIPTVLCIICFFVLPLHIFV